MLLDSIPNPTAYFPSPLASLCAFSEKEALHAGFSQVSVSNSAEGGPRCFWGQFAQPCGYEHPQLLSASVMPLLAFSRSLYKFRVHRISSVGRDSQGLLSLPPSPAQDNPKRSCGLFSFQYVLSSVLLKSVDLLSFQVCFPDSSEVP